MQRNEETLKEDNDNKQNKIAKLQTSVNSKDQKIFELEEKVKIKEERMAGLENKVSALKNFKTKVIKFILKIGSLLPNFNRLLDDEPFEIRNEIKNEMSKKEGLRRGQLAV